MMYKLVVVFGASTASSDAHNLTINLRFFQVACLYLVTHVHQERRQQVSAGLYIRLCCGTVYSTVQIVIMESGIWLLSSGISLYCLWSVSFKSCLYFSTCIYMLLGMYKYNSTKYTQYPKYNCLATWQLAHIAPVKRVELSCVAISTTSGVSISVRK